MTVISLLHTAVHDTWGIWLQADVDVVPNPDEVQQHKYVTAAELRRLMDPESGLQWSPWFRIIAKEFLDPWWADLQGTLTTKKHVDTITVHRIEL